MAELLHCLSDLTLVMADHIITHQVFIVSSSNSSINGSSGISGSICSSSSCNSNGSFSRFF